MRSVCFLGGMGPIQPIFPFSYIIRWSSWYGRTGIGVSADVILGVSHSYVASRRLTLL
jgi:hypothetical protein